MQEPLKVTGGQKSYFTGILESYLRENESTTRNSQRTIVDTQQERKRTEIDIGRVKTPYAVLEMTPVDKESMRTPHQSPHRFAIIRPTGWDRPNNDTIRGEFSRRKVPNVEGGSTDK